jgi:hypothetical protein
MAFVMADSWNEALSHERSQLENDHIHYEGSISPTFEHLRSMATMSDKSLAPATPVRRHGNDGTHILGHLITPQQDFPNHLLEEDAAEQTRKGWRPIKRIKAKPDEERKLPKLLSAKIEQASDNIMRLCSELATTMSERYGIFSAGFPKRSLRAPIPPPSSQISATASAQTSHSDFSTPREYTTPRSQPQAALAPYRTPRKPPPQRYAWLDEAESSFEATASSSSFGLRPHPASPPERPPAERADPRPRPPRAGGGNARVRAAAWGLGKEEELRRDVIAYSRRIEKVGLMYTGA